MDVRSRILDAALGLLAEGGGLTQTQVSKAAGIRQSHLTYYFPTITDLLQAVARHSFDSLAKELDTAAAGGQRPKTLGDGVAMATRDKRRVRMMLGLVTAADRDATLKPRMRDFVKELRGRIAPMLKAGGLDVGPNELAFIHTVVVGAAVLQLARDDDDAREEARAVLNRAIACIAKGEE